MDNELNKAIIEAIATITKSSADFKLSYHVNRYESGSSWLKNLADNVEVKITLIKRR